LARTGTCSPNRRGWKAEVAERGRTVEL
jgi:hypothetical protein